MQRCNQSQKARAFSRGACDQSQALAQAPMRKVAFLGDRIMEKINPDTARGMVVDGVCRIQDGLASVKSVTLYLVLPCPVVYTRLDRKKSDSP